MSVINLRQFAVPCQWPPVLFDHSHPAAKLNPLVQYCDRPRFQAGFLVTAIPDSWSTSLTLLDCVRQRTDAAAWDRFVKLYTPFLFYCCRRLGLQDQEAADVVQDVFVLLLDKLTTFQPKEGSSFRAWLRTVTENKCHER